jgi:tetratricopeptide (TPR) repeat protein
MGRFSKLELSGGAEPEETGGGDRDWLLLAERCLKEGAHEAALRYYSRALSQDSKLEQAWLGQLFCLVDLGENDEAVAWADRALAIHPGSGDLAAMKAVAVGRTGENDRALALSDSALKSDGAGALAWWARGDILLAEGGRTAEYCFRKALETGAKSWLVLFWIGKSWLSIGRPFEARTLLLRAREVDPDAPIVDCYLGLACQALGATDEAVASFRRALERNPALAEAREGLETLEKEGPFVRGWRRLSLWLSGRGQRKTR